jgi:hypothetical protein
MQACPRIRCRSLATGAGVVDASEGVNTSGRAITSFVRGMRTGHCFYCERDLPIL